MKSGGCGGGAGTSGNRILVRRAGGGEGVPVQEEFGEGALVGRVEGADGDVFRAV